MQIIKEEISDWERYDSAERGRMRDKEESKEYDAKYNLKDKVGNALEAEVGDWIYDNYTGWNDIGFDLSMDELKAELEAFAQANSGKSLKDLLGA